MKKVLSSVIVICLLGVLIGGGTFAYFQDVETSTGNTFTDGTLDLKVSDGDEGFGDGVSASWVMANMEPGVTTTDGSSYYSVLLQNSGSTAADHVEISFSHSIDENTNPVESDTNPSSTASDLAKWIEITAMRYNGSNFASSYHDANNNNFFDLEDLTLSPYSDVGGPLDNLSPPPANSGGTRTFSMTLKFNAGATNDIQGDTLTTTVTFTLNQVASQ